MKKLIRAIVNWAMQGSDSKSQDRLSISYGSSIASVPVHKNKLADLHDDDGITFVIFKAAGGKVVKSSFYNTVKDTWENRLYIITDNDDFGTEISQILIRESLSR